MTPDAGNNQKLDNKPGHHTASGFQNHPPVETAAPKGWLFYFRRFWNSVFLPDIPAGHALSEKEALGLWNSTDGNRITWVGHASFILNVSGKTILTDPFWSDFASPLSWAGPRRIVPPGIPLNSLPSIDILIISHNHYDHLDDATIRQLSGKENIYVAVPLGLKSFFTERGYGNVTEFDWGDSISIGGITLTALPSVHDSARDTDDHNRTLWASWAIETPSCNILFIGDTGYSEMIFKRIGESFGKFDYAILPIGAYEPRELMWMSHITPEEAVTVGMETRSNILIASHWGTINLSDESPWEPPKRFVTAGVANGLGSDNLWVMRIGETRPATCGSIIQTGK